MVNIRVRTPLFAIAPLKLHVSHFSFTSVLCSVFDYSTRLA